MIRILVKNRTPELTTMIRLHSESVTIETARRSLEGLLMLGTTPGGGIPAGSCERRAGSAVSIS
jgi:hypothetical protein